MSEERWLPIAGWEGHYEVSDHGRVRSVDRWLARKQYPYWLKGRVLTPSLQSGRPTVTLHRIGAPSRWEGVWILVAETFIGPRPEGMECCHYDDNPLNNHLSNLRWDTSSANSLDAVRNGKNPAANKTHCKNGHEFTSDNTYIEKRKHGRPTRVCRTCSLKRTSEWDKKHRAGLKAGVA